MLKRKPYIENHKKAAEAELRKRLEILKSKGMSDSEIQRDPKIKHCRAEIRQINHQLADIEHMESSILHKAEIKARKLTAPKDDHRKSKRSAPMTGKKWVKKEKKLAAET
jgi:hypothetical protein